MTKNELRKSHLDLAAIRTRLDKKRGRDYWRSLDELAGTEEFKRFLYDEFPGFSAGWWDSLSRRDLLKLMGASLALAGLSACSVRPAEKIVPYVHPPEEFVPGKPLYYATAMPLAGYGKGVLVESHMGRPTKVEGNPAHPASLGATDVFAQASVLDLYDPDRAQTVSHNGIISSWTSFIGLMNRQREAQGITGGAGLRILTETITSPTLAAQIQALLAEFPRARWYQYEPVGGDDARRGSIIAFGEYVNSYYRVDKADVILSLDSDFLTSGPACLRYSREWASRRQWQKGQGGMNRLYAVESSPSNTGMVADHRLPLRASEIMDFARHVAKEIGITMESPGSSPAPAEWPSAIARDLKAHRGASLVIPGDYQSAGIHVLAHAMNEALGNVGSTVIYTAPVEAVPSDRTAALYELVKEMEAGAVDTLVILGGNPVYTAPADLDFAGALSKVNLRIHQGLHEDETSRICQWNVPQTHYLETWSDIRAFDGTATIIQPLIAPLYDAKSAHELIAMLLGGPPASGYEIIRKSWETRNPGSDFERFWQDSLNNGLVTGTAFPPKEVHIRPDWANRIAAGNDQAKIAVSKTADSDPEVEILFRPDPSIFDGRFANNGWLQELPKPMTKLTWDNAALLGPATAERLGLQQRDMVEIRHGKYSLRAPVWLIPGHPNDAVTLHLGFGRSQAGSVGTGTGVNAYALRTSESLWVVAGAELRKVEGQFDLVSTQNHSPILSAIESEQARLRRILRDGTIGEYERNPRFIQEMGEAPKQDDTLYPGFDYSRGYQWGMTVNLNNCTGCNACVVACEAENNSPIVGKTQVSHGREMQWLRIDQYYEGSFDNPRSHLQPVLCMHCENAPCELVCPVQATNHSSEGLNQMVYNRCVGTRYCSNNCPYKVRHFNFLQFSDWNTPSLKPMRNPDVSVRGRGVMEKCTYCVQRIQEAKIQAEKEDRVVRDGEIRTACQQACPSQVFVFGNINDPDSHVSRLKADPLNYGMLADLNVRPRTSYLAKIRNPNPELERG